jgi:hypothetical protein
MRSIEEIRGYFLAELNHVFSRPGMYPGEASLMMRFRDLAWIDQREPEWDAHRQALEARGAFCSTGVRGAFERVLGERVQTESVASVYAEIAFQMGYLETQRVLSAAEFGRLRKGLRRAVSRRSFTAAEVEERFGPPSWGVVRGRNDPNSETWLYLASRPRFAAIAFEFWNESLFVDGKYARRFDRAILRYVRIRGRRFAREFAFTPLGRQLLDEDESTPLRLR